MGGGLLTEYEDMCQDKSVCSVSCVNCSVKSEQAAHNYSEVFQELNVVLVL